MERWQFNACMDGYTDRCTDNAATAILTGYWSAYYNNSKKPKLPARVIEQLYEKIDKIKSGEKPELDVDSFLAIEEQFQQRLALKKGEQDG